MHKYLRNSTNSILYSILEKNNSGKQSIRNHDAIHTVLTGIYTDEKLISYIIRNPDHADDAKSTIKSVDETTVTISPLSDNFKQELAARQMQMLHKKPSQPVKLFPDTQPQQIQLPNPGKTVASSKCCL